MSDYEGILHSSIPYMIGTLSSASINNANKYDVNYALHCLKTIKNSFDEFRIIVEKNCNHCLYEVDEYLFALDKTKSLLNEPESTERTHQLGIYQCYLLEKYKRSLINLAIELKKEDKYSI